MPKIKLITDSASDILKESEQELDIRILSFPITANNKGYRERIDFTPSEFYTLLYESEEIPVTAQITQFEFLEVFKEYHEEGYTDLIYVSINSKGSATYSNATMAKKSFYEKYPEAEKNMHIHLLDSKSYTGAYGYAVVQAAEKARKGMPVDEILAYLKDWLQTCHIYFATYSLRWAKKSGRISAAAAFMGELLGLRPIMTFDDGVSKILNKVRGDKAVVPAVLDAAEKVRMPHTPYVLMVGSNLEANEDFIRESEKRFGAKPEQILPIGAAIAINSGPETVAVAVKTSSIF